MRAKFYTTLGALLTTLSFSCYAALPAITSTVQGDYTQKMQRLGLIGHNVGPNGSNIQNSGRNATDPQVGDNAGIPQNIQDIIKNLKDRGLVVAPDPRGADEQAIFQKALAGTEQWEAIMKAEGRDYTQPVIMAWAPKRVEGNQVDGQLVVWDRSGNELARFNFGRSSSGQTPDGVMLGICEEYNGQPGSGSSRNPTWMNMNAKLDNSVDRINTPCDIHASSVSYPYQGDPLPRLTTAGCTAVQNYNDVRNLFYAVNDYAKAQNGAAPIIYNGNYNFQENLVAIPSITYRGIKYINGQTMAAKR